MKYSIRRRNLAIMSTLLLFILLYMCSCGEQTKEGSVDLRFIFIGDVHYKYPDYAVTKYFVPDAARAFSKLEPNAEFVIQTGDFLHASQDTDIDAEASFAFRHFSENIGIPFFMTKGNHDTRKPFEKYGLPIFSRELDREIIHSYYSFNKANCHFIMLDCTDEELSDQLEWLEDDLKKASGNDEVKHIFVAGHFPLWPVARAGFTRPEYTEPVTKILAKYKVDAYFCGHTHNHSTTVRLINGTPLTQIMGAVVRDEVAQYDLAPVAVRVLNNDKNRINASLIPLEEEHNILIPKEELQYSWGYQEGTNSSYFIITVTGSNVQVDFYVLNKGHLHSFKWEKPGELINLKEPIPVVAKKITDADFKTIEQAWLYTAPFTEQKQVEVPFTINGVDAGILDLSNLAKEYSPFWDKIEVPINESALAAIKRDNTLRFIAKNNYEFALAHTLLLIRLSDGRYAKSTVSANIFANYQLSRTSNFASPEKLMRFVEIGQDIEDEILSFDSILDIKKY